MPAMIGQFPTWIFAPAPIQMLSKYCHLRHLLSFAEMKRSENCGQLRFDKKNTSSLVNYLKKMDFQCVVISLKDQGGGKEGRLVARDSNGEAGRSSGCHWMADIGNPDIGYGRFWGNYVVP
eukprot:Skav223738  [mRNA]  locus=scaffold2572:148809:149171:+ [translate_table: standard]